MQTPFDTDGARGAPLRGDFYDVDLEAIRGSESAKRRPAPVVQGDTGDRYSPVVIVVPVSSVKEITKGLPVMVFLRAGEGGLTKDCFADCGQVRTIDKARLI